MSARNHASWFFKFLGRTLTFKLSHSSSTMRLFICNSLERFIGDDSSFVIQLLTDNKRFYAVGTFRDAFEFSYPIVCTWRHVTAMEIIQKKRTSRGTNWIGKSSSHHDVYMYECVWIVFPIDVWWIGISYKISVKGVILIYF